jgi:chorismate mutase/prephenate dehydratase
MDIRHLREEIDRIDSQLIELFLQRMDISAQVAQYKLAHNLPIHVPAREQEILDAMAEKAGPEMDVYARTLYEAIFELSRSYQAQINQVSEEHA